MFGCVFEKFGPLVEYTVLAVMDVAHTCIAVMKVQRGSDRRAGRLALKRYFHLIDEISSITPIYSSMSDWLPMSS